MIIDSGSYGSMSEQASYLLSQICGHDVYCDSPRIRCSQELNEDLSYEAYGFAASQTCRYEQSMIQ